MNIHDARLSPFDLPPVHMNNSRTILDPSKKVLAAHNSCALAVMIKAPRAGEVKTRLIPPLTPDEASELSICFLRDTAANIANVACATNAQGVIVYTPQGAESAFDGLLPDGFSLLAQRGASFGDRLFNATQDLLAVGYESLCLINSDSPTLPAEMLIAAVKYLAREGDRAALGAAEDGGYYLIGLKRAHRRLFTDIDWSTERVLAQTIERASEINLEVEVLPSWYDVDDAGSLNRLRNELFSSNGHRAGQHKSTEYKTTEYKAAGYEAPRTRDYLARLIEAKGRKRLWLAAERKEAGS
jgi:uncharacterized protein